MKRIIIPILILVFSIALLYADTDKEIGKKFKLRVQTDNKKGVTTYTPKGVSARSRIFLYMVKNDSSDQITLRLRIAYFAESMLFIKRYILYADDREFVLTVRGQVRMQDLGRVNLAGTTGNQVSGGVCEYYDIAVNPNEIDIMQQIADAKSAKMRYEGNKGYKKVKIHKGEVKDIKRVLEAFEALTKNEE
jgi:hypothetical protein